MKLRPKRSGRFGELGATLVCYLLVAFPSSAAAKEHANLLVKWTEGPTSETARDGNSALNARVVHNYNQIGWQLVELPQGISEQDGLAAYARLRGVIAVEPNMPQSPVRAGDPTHPAAKFTPQPAFSSKESVPDDPLWEFQWNLEKIDAPAAWTEATTSSNAIVVVIDTGVDYTHEDLGPNMWKNPGESGLDEFGRDRASNGVDDDGNGYIDDVYGIDVVDGDSDPMDEGFITIGVPVAEYHGTACAGIIGALANNGKGVAGLSRAVSIMSIRALWYDLDHQFNQALFNAHLLEAFDYLIQMKRRGVNIRATCNSYGNATYSQAFLDAIQTAGNEGILNIFAAGNNYLNNDEITFYPAGYNSPSVLAVAASTETDDLWGLSNYGLSTVHLAAPGLQIPTLERANRYTIGFSGTSAAAPHVAGAVALLASADPSATRDEIKAALMGSVDPVPALRDQVMTHGRLNVARALERLTNKAHAPPIVIAAQPAGSRTRQETIEVTFSNPMDRESVEEALTISPTEQGRFEWSSDSRQCRFQPDQPLVRTNHSVTIWETAVDQAGLMLDGNFDGVWSGPSDAFTWSFDFPLVNDDFIDALLITGSSGSLAATTRNASPEPNEPDHAGNPLSATSVWFRWTSPTEGPVVFEVENAQFDSLLAVYSGSDLGSLIEIASNDDAEGPLSRVMWVAAAGATYKIAVAGKSLYRDKFYLDQHSFGEFRLKWDSPTLQLQVRSNEQGFVTLQWPAVPNTVELESTMGLTGSGWRAVTNQATLTDAGWVLKVPLELSQQYFRLGTLGSAPVHSGIESCPSAEITGRAVGSSDLEELYRNSPF